MKNNLDRELLADVAEKLISHLQERKDVQNIDLMNLSGFCRNCLSKWYVSAAQKRNIDINYDLLDSFQKMKTHLNTLESKPKIKYYIKLISFYFY